MANSANYFGFKAAEHPSGQIRTREFEILYSYSTKIYSGDPVKLASDGTIQLAAAGDTNILGIFAGAEWIDSDGVPRFEARWTAPLTTLGSVNGKAHVHVDREIIYHVRSGGTPAQTNIGNLADHVAGTGSDLNGQSGAYLSGTMGTGDAGFRILGFAKQADNEVGQYAILAVQIFETGLSYNDAATPGV